MKCLICKSELFDCKEEPSGKFVGVTLYDNKYGYYHFCLGCFLKKKDWMILNDLKR